MVCFFLFVWVCFALFCFVFKLTLHKDIQNWEQLLYFLPPYAKQDFLHLLAGCASSLPRICRASRDATGAPGMASAALLTAKAPGTGAAAPTQLWFSDSARSCQQNPAPETPCLPSPCGFPCVSGWSCPPTRNWGTNTSRRRTDSRCVDQSTAFPLTDPQGLWLPAMQQTYICKYRTWKNKTM